MKRNFLLKDKIFVAGAAGMAGSAIVRSLNKNGYGGRDSLGELLIPTKENLNLLNSKKVKEWFIENSPDVVILAAAKVGGIIANSTKPADFLLENLKIQTNVIEAAFNYGSKRLIFLGSSCIYPKFAQQPIKEESLLSNFLEPTNESYAIAKIAGIKLCQSLRIQYGFDAISLMPTNLYGPNDNFDPTNSHVIASLIRKFHEAKYKGLSEVICWGSGKPLREFMHVDDLGDAVVFALENWHPDSKGAPLDEKGKPLTYLNVGSSEEISIKDLAKLIAREFDYKGNILWDQTKPDGTPRKKLNTEKMQRLGWHSKIMLEEGIASTIKIYKKNYLYGYLQ